MEERHVDNVYALNLKDDEVFIEDSESGRKGYLCMGCKRPMEAVKTKIVNRRSYFRHVVKAKEDGRKCTYSDETYRHKLAKEILQETKRIKVPAIYKFPPKGSEDWPNLISEAKFIEAHTVGIERNFFEDQNGNIIFGKNINSEGKYLLIRPDVTFFDEDQKPILFIELVATHKVTVSKKIKIKRLGIDTVQVSIPKDSLEAIGNVFSKSNRTKWIYNYEQENTQYIPILTSDREGIQFIDQDQRKLFGESFKCRTAQIGNLVRTIGRCLGSEYYRGIEQQIGSELSRVEENTEKGRLQWAEIQKKRRKEISEKYGRRVSDFRSKRKRLEEGEREFEEENNDLEKRYLRKKEEINWATENYQREGRIFAESEKGITETIEKERLSIQAIEEELEKDEITARNFEQNKDELRRGFKLSEGESIKSIERATARTRRELFEIRARIEAEKEKNRKDEERISERFDFDRGEFRLKFEDRNRQIIEHFEIEEISSHGGVRKVTRKVNEFSNAMAILKYLPTKYRNRERIRAALEAIRIGAYKNWEE